MLSYMLLQFCLGIIIYSSSKSTNGKTTGVEIIIIGLLPVFMFSLSILSGGIFFIFGLKNICLLGILILILYLMISSLNKKRG